MKLRMNTVLILPTVVVLLLSSCNGVEPPCVTCPPPGWDTTSHFVQCQPADTLGVYGSISDVWVFS